MTIDELDALIEYFSRRYPHQTTPLTYETRDYFKNISNHGDPAKIIRQIQQMNIKQAKNK